MDKKDRLKEAFEYLRGKGEIHTQKDLAERMRTTPPNVSSALKGNVDVLTDNFLQRFNSAFNDIFSLDWLLTGEGSMLKDGEPAESTNETQLLKERIQGLEALLAEKERLIKVLEKMLER